MRRDDDDFGVRARAATLGEDALNDLDKWRLRNLHDQERQTQAAQREQGEIERLRMEMWREISRLRDEVEQRREQQVEIIGTAIGEYGDKLLDDAERFTRRVQHEVITLVETRFAQLQTRIDTAAPASRSKEFKFANESREPEPLDLPSGFLRKTTLN
jgi:hypothetical protein